MSVPAAPPGPGTGPGGSAATVLMGVTTPSPAIAAPSSQTYAELYADASRFPSWHDDYNDAVGIVTIPPAGLPSTGADVQIGVRNSEDSLPQTWMALFADPTDPTSMGEIRILHRHSFFAAPMSRPADPNIHDRMYAFFEDFQAGQQIYTVYIPGTYFNSTLHSQVPDWAVLNQATKADSLPEGQWPFPAKRRWYGSTSRLILLLDSSTVCLPHPLTDGPFPSECPQTDWTTGR
jgi:hypothetical protein